MQRNNLIGGLRITMQALAGKFGIGLTFSGQTAFTDRKRINLPVLDHIAERDVAVLARGYVDHEAAHIRFTDFEIKNSKWQNILEDIRIEREMAKAYPGAAINLKNLVGHLKQDGESFLGVREQPVSVLQSWALCWGRSRLLQQDLADYATRMAELAGELWEAELCAAFKSLLEKLPGCGSTEDCRRLAQEIEDLLGQSQLPAEQLPQDGTEEGETEQPDDEAQRDSPGERLDIGQIMRDRLQQVVESTPGPAVPLAAPYQSNDDPVIANTFYGQMDWSDIDPGNKPEYYNACRIAQYNLQDLRLTRRQTAQLRAGLDGLLQSVRLQPSRRAASGQRLAGSDCYLLGMKTPDTRVFRRNRPKINNNTAIAILVDTSSSMQQGCPTRSEVATQATFVIARALEAITGIETIVGHFPAAWTNPDNMRGVHVVKDFGEKCRLENFLMPPVGGTPLRPALLWGGMQLGHRPEPRKILLVITDGEVSNTAEAWETVQIVAKAGVEVYAIGIETAQGTSWLPPRNGVVVQEVAELPRAMIGMLKRVLLPASR